MVLNLMKIGIQKYISGQITNVTSKKFLLKLNFANQLSKVSDRINN